MATHSGATSARLFLYSLTGFKLMVALLLHASIVFAQEAAIDTKNILVLDGGPWSSRYKTELYLAFTNEFLDLSSAGCCVTYRFIDDNNYLQTTSEAQELRLLATQYRIDLIVGIELAANFYLLHDPQDLFINTPKLVLFPSASLNSKLIEREDFHVVAGNGREYSRDTINHIFNLLPLTQHLYVVSGPSEGDVELQVGARQLLSERDGLDINDLTSIHFLNGLPLSDLKSQISELPPNSAILFLSYRGTENGRSVNSVDVVKQLHGITSAPIFASNRTLLGHGIMGGSLVGAADVGREAAQQAYDLLYGVTTLAAEAPSIPGVDAFDWRELQRWRISEARLSAGSEVFFRPTGLWDRYKPAILGMLAFSILLVTFVVVLGILLRRSRAMEGQLVTAAARTEALQDKLLQSQKMKALGVLAGGVAHEFNNILAAIIGYAELSLDSVDKETDLREYLDNILAASLRGQNVTSQIMSFSRNRDTRLEPMQPHVVVQEVIDLVSETIPASIQIDVDVDDHAGWIHGNSGQVHQIVMNLCTNAYQSIEDSGRITVALSRAHYSAHDQKTQLGPGDYLVITVSDTGIGMDADALRQVYDPFYTTHKTSEATGLGLSIVYGIVSEHHGHIEMASERGSGTSVQVYFPAMDEPDKQDTGSKNLDGTEGDEHILWVDDEPMLVRLGKVALEKHGYSVTTAGSGDHALELFEQQPDFFSLIITDYAMPGMTGVALSKRIWKVRSKVPIILYTGFSDHVDQESATRMGFSTLLLKPLEMSGMIKTVRRVLDASSQKLSA